MNTQAILILSISVVIVNNIMFPVFTWNVTASCRVREAPSLLAMASCNFVVEFIRSTVSCNYALNVYREIPMLI